MKNLYFFLFIQTNIFAQYNFNNDLSFLLDIKNISYKKNISFNETSHQGDFYFLEKYVISKKDICKFLKKNKKLLPFQKPFGNSKVIKSNWTSHIDKIKYKWVFTVLNYLSRNKFLVKELKKVKKLLNNPSIYVAFYISNSNPPDKEILFILYPKLSILYIIQVKI